MSRGDRRWLEWDMALQGGARPVELVPALADESIVELLAAGNPESRSYELNLLAAELSNRLARVRRVVGEAARTARHEFARAIDEAEEAASYASESANKVRDHMEVRRDQIANEPQVADQAARAAREVHRTLDEARDTEERLVRLEEEVRRRARPEDD